MNDISSLRSQLQFHLHEELKNLTEKELKECSWRTSRMIFSALVGSSRILHDKSEKLLRLNEERTRRIKLLRNQHDCREDRRRVEEEYRHAFYEVILQALIDIQFPPANEPFSDPLTSLKDSLDFKLSSMSYLLENCFGVDISSQPPTAPKSQKRTVRSHRKHTDPNIPSPRGRCIEDSTVTSIQNAPQPENIFDEANFDVKEKTIDSHVTSDSAASNSIFLDQTFSEYDSLRESYMVLQHHNEQLSKQLKVLQNAVVSRHSYEDKMELLMHDFASMVSDVADASVVNEDATITPVQLKSPRLVTSKRRPMSSSSKEKAPYTSKGATNNNTCIGDSSRGSLHWRQLKLQISDLISRWLSLRRDAKKCVLSTVKVPVPESNSFRNNSFKRRDSYRKESGSSLKGRGFTPVRKNTSQRLENDSTSPSREGKFEESCEIVLHRVLGVNVPLGFTDNESIHSNSSAGGLDLSRVHELQRDLVSFARDAFTLSQSLLLEKRPIADKADDCSGDSLQQMVKLSQLRQRSSSLLLHSSSISPYMPLSCASRHLSSSKTGVDALFGMVEPILQVKKSWTPEIQAAFDRCRSEQYSLALSLSQSDLDIKNWQALGQQLSLAFSEFGNYFIKKCKASLKDFREKAKSIFGIVNYVSRAETSRISIPGYSPAPINPMEALSNGFLGQRLAELVQCLRINSPDIQKFCSSSTSFEEDFLRDIVVQASIFHRYSDAIAKLL